MTPSIRRGDDPDASQRTPSWRFSSMDIDSPWCPKTTISREALWGLIHPRILSFETMTWDEIKRGTKSHYVSVGKLDPDARKRLEVLELDDTEFLFSLRLQGKPRLWGLLINGVFHVGRKRNDDEP